MLIAVGLPTKLLVPGLLSDAIILSVAIVATIWALVGKFSQKRASVTAAFLAIFTLASVATHPSMFIGLIGLFLGASSSECRSQ